MFSYHPLDLRRLDEKTISNCTFYQFEKSQKLNFSSKKFFEKQEDSIKLEELSQIFTDSYTAPEVFSVKINECTVTPRCPKLPRYWGMFFDKYYAFNFINDMAKVNFQKFGFFEVNNNIINVNINTIPKVRIEGISLWLYPFGNLDHLLRECLPILNFISQMGFKLNDLNYITPELDDQLLKFLVELGLPKENIIRIDHKWLSFEQLIIPCFGSFGHLHTPTMHYIHTANRVVSSLTKENHLVAKTSHKRIYVSRNKATFRKTLNEYVLEEELQKRGFVIIDPGVFSKSDQVKLFKDAEIIVEPHGMGIANSAFSQNLKLILEIMNTDYNRVSYFRTAQLRNATYAAYYVEPTHSNYRNNQTLAGDIIIDKNKFLEFLDKVMDSL
ncbi:glycosyltransferase family 61 protein [Neisseria weaveri]|uniref:glycosyltransferase family 61 protein n=1 Tax=Neisseria weaveri TaxID=28091 RepID=UPI000D3123B1|nr:glycosyltransferase family 61 protein [Neisseria weaveri]